MFPLTHLYTAKAVLGYETKLSALGSLFPDYGAYLGIGRNVCHEMGIDMYYYALENDKSHIDFALGALTHGTALPGIDWYADEEYHGIRPGFCFQSGEAIAGEVAKACNLPQNMAIWKTHNIMELAFDVITEQKHPGIAKTVLTALPEEGNPYCTSFLHHYLGKSEKEITEMFTEVTGYYSLDGKDIGQMADKFILSLKRRHHISGCDRDALISLIYRAVEIVEPVYDGFMDEAISGIISALQKRTGITPRAAKQN